MNPFYKNEAIRFEQTRGFNGNDMFASGVVPIATNIASEEESQPFILSLENTTGKDIDDVTIFDAAAGIDAINKGVTAGIVASYGYSGISYATLLQWMVSKTFQIGRFQVITTTDAQALKSFEVKTRNMFGGGVFASIVPRMPMNATKTGNIEQACKFAINNSTVITLKQIAAGLTVDYYFFPDVMEKAGGVWEAKTITSSQQPLVLASR